MEQQTQTRAQQGPEEQTRQDPVVRTPERERLSGPGQLARAVLEGGSLWEMPPQRLEELASLLGNQGMAALLERQGLPVEETRFTLPEAAETVPAPVPPLDADLTAPPSGLTAEAPGGRAFDPAGLVYSGGAYGADL